MKKTQQKDAYRNIKKRIVSFLSICLVIMLGLGGVFITRYMGAGIEKEATDYYNDHAFKDYELISSLGITDDDLSQIKETEGITDAEGVIRSSGSIVKGDLNFPVELISMTERISIPEVIDGRAPSAKDECMIAEDTALVKGIKVGDKVSLTMDNVASPLTDQDADFEVDTDQEDAAAEEEPEEAEEEEAAKDALLADEFTVTGLMKHPDYLRRKSVDTVALPLSAYDKEVTEGYYTHAFVKAEEPENVGIFKDKYFEETAGTRAALEKLTETLAVDSTDRAKKKAYDYIDAEWKKAEAQLDDAQMQIDDGEAQLNSELADARKQLADAQALLDKKVGDYKEQIAKAEKKIKAAEKKIKEGKKKIKDGESKIKEAKEQKARVDENLPEFKKHVKEMTEKYQGDLEATLTELNKIQSMIAKLDKLNVDSEEYKEAVADIAKFILEKKELILKVRDFCKNENVQELAEKIKEITDGKADATGMINKIANFDYDTFFVLAEKASKGESIEEFVKQLKEHAKEIQSLLDEYKQYQSYIDRYEANKKTLEERLKAEEKKLQKAKDKLAKAEAELAAAKEKLANGKKQLSSEKKKYEAKIRNGWNLYYSQKAEYEQKLAEAMELLAENREMAEQKLAEAKAEVEEIDGKWLVFDRRANAGYVDAKSNIAAVASASVAFGILFMLISAVVCFSTLTIVIDEQKKMVGTVKAFGFLKREVLRKYMVFGVTAAIIGCIAGILLALGLSGLVLRAYHNAGMYQFGMAKSIVTPGPTLLSCAIMIGICAIATVIACSGILRSPASVLMKGVTLKESNGSTKTTSKKGGSLYSKLILRNMRDDKARVAISIIIIAFSTMLMGIGISMKLAYDGMSTKQIGEVYNYDVRVDLGDNVSDADKQKIEEVISADGGEYMSASYETHIFHLGDRLDALYVLTANADKLGNFFTVRDSKTGEVMEIPKDGVLAQKKMKESYGFDEGSKLSIMNSELESCDAPVKGIFQNYVGRVVITSPAGYRKIFGEDPTFNCYYVKAGGTDVGKLQGDLEAVNDGLAFEVAREFTKKFEAVSLLYNLVVYVTTGIAILMSVMILSNLANIFLNRKKTELSVMRINGFSIKQTRGYLSKETFVTTSVGVVLGVLAGAVITPFIIKTMEQPDLQFIRSFHPVAWIAAVALEVLFAVVINSLVFRKVKDLDFRDVA